MKKYKLFALGILVAILCIFDTVTSYCQPRYAPKVDTLNVIEGKFENDAIISILDSAFTFLKLPPLELGLQYCYILYFEQDTTDLRLEAFYDIRLKASEVSWFHLRADYFNELEKIFINYKGKQIVVFLSGEGKISDGLLKYIKPTSTVGKYYNHYKNYEDKTYALSGEEKFTSQEVRFVLDTRNSKFIFRDYKLEIFGNEWTR